MNLGFHDGIKFSIEIPAGQNIILVKLGSINPSVNNIEDFYFVEGVLLEDYIIGRPIKIARIKSSKHGLDKEVPGIFQTSPTQGYSRLDLGNHKGYIIETKNSFYYLKIQN